MGFEGLKQELFLNPDARTQYPNKHARVLFSPVLFFVGSEGKFQRVFADHFQLDAALLAQDDFACLEIVIHRDIHLTFRARRSFFFSFNNMLWFRFYARRRRNPTACLFDLQPARTR